jgi:fumarate hydratase class II
LEEPQGISEFKKTLDGISDTVKSISDAQEALAKRVGDLEDAPAGRKTTAVGKGIGATEVAPEKTLDEALKEAEKQYVNSPNLFAIKQRIRREYKDKGWE